MHNFAGHHSTSTVLVKRRHHNWFCLFILLASCISLSIFWSELEDCLGFLWSPDSSPKPQAPTQPPTHPTEAISWVPFQQLVVHNSVPQCTQCSVPLAVTFVPLLDSIYCALPFGCLVRRGAKLLQPHPTTLLPPPHPMIGASPHPASDGCTSNVPPPLPSSHILPVNT